MAYSSRESLASNTNDAVRAGAEKVSAATDKVSEAAASIANKASAKIGEALETAETSVSAVAEQGRDAGQRVQEVAGNLKGAIDKSVKEQPMATLAVAAMMGLVLGALWKS